MKFAAFALLAAFTSIASAQAGPRDQFEGPALCGMTFEARGGGVQILVGHYELRGRGEIKCTDAEGNETTMPVFVQFGGRSPVALKIAIGGQHIVGAATGVGYARGPEELLGDYLLVGADASIGVGAGANAALHAKRAGALTLDVNVQAQTGFGVNAGFQSLTIYPASR